jgi:hypothetical protein
MESSYSRFVARTIGIVTCALCLASGTATAGKKCDKIIEEFVLMTTRISGNVSDPQERTSLQKEALKDLIKNARSVYGPFCPCEEFLEKAEAFQKHREEWRSPPPGWEPNKSRADFLSLETEIAHEDIRLLMQLMELCKRY